MHVVTPESFVSEYGTLGLVLNSLNVVLAELKVRGGKIESSDSSSLKN